MNLDTGEIREFQSQAQAELAGFLQPLTDKPKPSCKKCFGRGYIGINDNGKYVPCTCCCKAPKEKL